MVRWCPGGSQHLVGPHLGGVGVEGRVVVGLPEEGLDGQQNGAHLQQRCSEEQCRSVVQRCSAEVKCRRAVQRSSTVQCSCMQSKDAVEKSSEEL